jgi:hypothetical protein
LCAANAHTNAYNDSNAYPHEHTHADGDSDTDAHPYEYTHQITHINQQRDDGAK